MRKEYTTTQVMALAAAPGEGMGQVVELPALVEGLKDPTGKALAAKLKGSQAAAIDIRNIEVRDRATKQWRPATAGEARLVKAHRGVC